MWLWMVHLTYFKSKLAIFQNKKFKLVFLTLMLEIRICKHSLTTLPIHYLDNLNVCNEGGSAVPLWAPQNDLLSLRIRRNPSMPRETVSAPLATSPSLYHSVFMPRILISNKKSSTKKLFFFSNNLNMINYF